MFFFYVDTLSKWLLREPDYCKNVMSVMDIQWTTVHQDSHKYSFYIVSVYCDFVPEETKLAKIIFLFVFLFVYANIKQYPEC